MRCCSCGRQPGVQREHLGVAQLAAAQEVGGVVDLPLAGQEHEDIAEAVQLVDGVADRLHLVTTIPVGVVAEGAVAHLDRDRCGR